MRLNLLAKAIVIVKTLIIKRILYLLLTKGRDFARIYINNLKFLNKGCEGDRYFSS